MRPPAAPVTPAGGRRSTLTRGAIIHRPAPASSVRVSTILPAPPSESAGVASPQGWGCRALKRSIAISVTTAVVSDGRSSASRSDAGIPGRAGEMSLGSDRLLAAILRVILRVNFPANLRMPIRATRRVIVSLSTFSASFKPSGGKPQRGHGERPYRFSAFH
jgi:hypothetical protein